MMPTESVTQPLTWRSPRARRFALLIDAESYFSAFLSALRQARHSVMILAWDIDPRVVLNPNARPAERMSLGQAIRDALARSPELRVRILCWDFAMVYGVRRHLFPGFFREFRHPRIELILDSRHPFGASHHQKIVVMDDRIAFVGGLDLCTRRWDSRRHRALDPRRRDPAGAFYAPFHDIQAVIDGDAARSLAELARERWLQAGGGNVTPRSSGALWPFGVRPDLEQVMVGIARTSPAREKENFAREIEAVFLDSIRRARRWVYIENQYFTSERIAEAMLERALEPNGPEFAIILPRTNSGLIEKVTMGVLRNRLIRHVRASDPGRRIRFYYPVAIGRRRVPISLHSKLMIVDEEILHTGSANLSNRSMGLDTECDVVIEADRPDRREAIARIRATLLAEHLDARITSVREMLGESASIHQAIESLSARSNTRRALVPFPEGLHVPLASLVPSARIIDPDRPVDDAPLFSEILPKDRPGFLLRKGRSLNQKLALLIALVAICSLPGVRAVVQPARAIDRLQAALSVPEEILAATVVFLVGSLVSLTSDVLIFVVCVIFGSFLGWIYSLAGLIAVSLLGYAAGVVAARKPRRPRPPREQLRYEFWAHLLVHLNLVGPLWSLSRRSGGASTSLLAFAGGTIAGELIRITIISGYVMLTLSALRRPELGSWALFLVASAAIWGAFRWSSHRFLPTYGARFGSARRHHRLTAETKLR